MSEDADIDQFHPCQCCGIERDGYTTVCGCSYQICMKCELCIKCCDLSGLCSGTRALVRRASDADLSPFDKMFLKILKVRW